MWLRGSVLLVALVALVGCGGSKRDDARAPAAAAEPLIDPGTAPVAKALRPAPDALPRVRAIGPSPARVRLGQPGAAVGVSGPALDLCLLVTRRRHRNDLALEATGPVADEWLDIAQAYAGPAGAGRRPAGAPT